MISHDFPNSFHLRRTLIQDFYRQLSDGVPLLEALLSIDPAAGFMAVLEGVISYPYMPPNFKELESELNLVGIETIKSQQRDKVGFFKSVVNGYHENKIYIAPFDLITLIWMLMEDDNLDDLVRLLPNDTQELQIENFLNIDLHDCNERQRVAIQKYRTMSKQV